MARWRDVEEEEAWEEISIQESVADVGERCIVDIGLGDMQERETMIEGNCLEGRQKER